MNMYLTGDAASDALLDSSPLALLLGMQLDQQVTMETAFAGPEKLRQRLGTLDAATIAHYDPEAFVEICRQTPAVHRFPGSMAARMQELCGMIERDWGGDAEAIWTAPTADGNPPSGAEVLTRLKQLPGFGEQKARIFLALLGKQRGLKAAGWREAAGPYGGEDTCHSVADITDAETLARVREAKKAAKAAAKKA
ncbi:HhH-GPD-type base excision DNA repair protein [Microterricola pindariensis]|uniref:Fe-S cluster assembly protein HesB n=1 Tax=Microterricola pindariensis TaxID=478010 RepID=A0ABX5AZE1_9MICO|nr:HhH-GPD-type base excision DNA repair protein [Microterricola pindariensis]PPL19889.1 Fe-S cluster assembly protein HesB [Microterricola pindariensis]